MSMVRFLYFSSSKFATSAYLRVFTVYSVVRSRAMSNLAAGKKAAAVKAVNDYVKVGD